MASESLLRILKRLRRRVLWVEGTSGVGWGLVGGAACLAAGAWIDLVLELSPFSRITMLLAAVAVACILLARTLFWALGKIAPGILARRLDHVAETGGQIHSGVDLSRPERPTFGAGNIELTNGLAEMAIARAAGLAAGVSRSRAVSARPIGRSFGTFALIAVAATVLVFTLPKMASTQWLRFSDPFGDHPPFSRVSFTVEPEGARVIYGSGLEVHVSTEGPPVEMVELVLIPQDSTTADSQTGSGGEVVLPMFPEPGNRWRAAIANITAPQTYYVRAGHARSHKYAIQVITVPKIEDVRFRITAPKYTGLPVYEGELPQGGVAGLPGTTVELWAHSNRPLSGGRLTFVSKTQRSVSELLPSADGQAVAIGRFPIKESGRIEVQVIDESGQISNESFSAPVTLLTDERPFVRLIEPRVVSFATPAAVVPVVISAEDDYGVSRCRLYRSLNDSRYLPMEINVATPPPRRLYDVVRLPLMTYGLEPGDEIKLFARVEDNDPAGAADGQLGKGAESSITTIRIISQEDFQQMMRTRDGLNMLTSKYQQAQRRLEALAEEVDQLLTQLADAPPDSQAAQEHRDALKKLARRMEEESEAMRKLSESKLPYDLDRELNPQLEKLSDSLQRLAKLTEALAGNSKATNKELAQELSEIREAIKQQRKEHDEAAMLPLELLRAVYRLSEDEQRFIQIYQRQRDLAERLASLKGRDGEDDPELKARMRDLEEEQRQIRADLALLLDDIEQHVTQLPDDPRMDALRDTALKFCSAVRTSGATEAMIDAETGLTEFSGTRGHAGAKEAADILESFLQQCKGMGPEGEGGACLPKFQPQLGNCLGQTISQLLADAGFKPGTGTGRGQGAGGGYSTRRSSLQNVGMYGGLPQYDAASAQAGNSDSHATAAAGRAAAQRAAGAGDASAYEAAGSLQASGAGDADVPLRYRRKVGRYFQQIADELSER